MRVTVASAKPYIFQIDLNGKTIRLTIGDPRTCTIGKAQTEANKLKTFTDQGIDPRQLKADYESAKEAQAAALVIQESSESVTFGMA